MLFSCLVNLIFVWPTVALCPIIVWYELLLGLLHNTRRWPVENVTILVRDINLLRNRNTRKNTSLVTIVVVVNDITPGSKGKKFVDVTCNNRYDC